MISIIWRWGLWIKEISLKKGDTCERVCRRGGHQSLFICCIDTVLVNSYLLSFHSNVSKKEKYTNQDDFRTILIAKCFSIGKAKGKRKRASAIAELPNIDT